MNNDKTQKQHLLHVQLSYINTRLNQKIAFAARNLFQMKSRMCHADTRTCTCVRLKVVISIQMLSARSNPNTCKVHHKLEYATVTV